MKKEIATIMGIACLSAASMAQAEMFSSYNFDNATVQVAGPRSGNNGKTYLNIEGPDKAQYAAYGVLDFHGGAGTDTQFTGSSSTASVTTGFGGIGYTVGSINSMSIDLTEGYPPSSWYTTGTLQFWVVTDATSSIQPGFSSTLFYDNTTTTGFGDQLGSAYLLGSGQYNSSWGNGAERHNITLTSFGEDAETLLIDALNTDSNFRIVISGVGNVGAGLEGQYVFGGTRINPMLYLDVTELVTTLPGDYNGDGVVDNGDYVFWADQIIALNSGGTADTAADGNGDGIVDNGDYVFWADQIIAQGQQMSLSVSSVPEPASALVLLTLGGLGLVRRRRHA